MSSRMLFLVAFLALLGALLSLGFADRGSLPPEALAAGCGDWWCAERNTWPVALALGFGGIGAVALALGSVALLPDDEPPALEPVAEPRRPQTRPLWATRRRDHS